jgi:hypothetical protein
MIWVINPNTTSYLHPIYFNYVLLEFYNVFNSTCPTFIKLIFYLGHKFNYNIFIIKKITMR